MRVYGKKWSSTKWRNKSECPPTSSHLQFWLNTVRINQRPGASISRCSQGFTRPESREVKTLGKLLPFLCGSEWHKLGQEWNLFGNNMFPSAASEVREKKLHGVFPALWCTWLNVSSNGLSVLTEDSSPQQFCSCVSPFRDGCEFYSWLRRAESLITHKIEHKLYKQRELLSCNVARHLKGTYCRHL